MLSNMMMQSLQWIKLFGYLRNFLKANLNLKEPIGKNVYAVCV